jgi:hypothetical protein
VFAGVLIIAAPASQLPETFEDLARSASAIHDQQVSLALWARDNTPKEARLGVNDAGALAFYSERPTFDVVGLTTKGESRHWVEGPGSRFEHYEHLPRALLPSHWIVYPEWFAIPPLLGEHLTSRTVNATILGGHTMSAHLMDASALGSGNLPDLHALPSFALVLPDSEDRGAGVTDDEARPCSTTSPGLVADRPGGSHCWWYPQPGPW